VNVAILARTYGITPRRLRAAVINELPGSPISEGVDAFLAAVSASCLGQTEYVAVSFDGSHDQLGADTFNEVGGWIRL
jgi:hypothetical protein